MHDAPSVNFPVGRCSLCGAVQQWSWGLALLLAAGVAVWARRPWVWSLGLVLLWAIGALIMTRQVMPQGLLAWRSGVPEPLRGWYWTAADTEQELKVTELSVLLDLQRGMLLTLRLSNRERVTLWAQRKHAPVFWSALRQALWYHAGSRM